MALRALPLLLTAVMVLGSTSSVDAQTGNGDQQQQLQAQVGQLDQAQAAALTNLQAVQQQKAGIDARVADLNSQLSVAEAKLAPLAAEAARLDASVAALESTINTTQANLDEARRAFDTSAAGLYRSARAGSEYGTVLAAQPDDLVAQKQYLGYVARQRKDLVARVGALRDELEQQRKTVVAEQSKADTVANGARAVRDQIASATSQLAPAQAQAAQQSAAVQGTLTQIQGAKTQDQAELASLQAASDGLAAQLRSRGGGGTAAGSCQARPVPGDITSGFGPRDGGFHPGVDMDATYGEPIHACRGGTVVSAGWQGGYGNAVVIDHGGGMATLYGHQSRLGVSAGQQVNAGDVIGYIGSTGFSTGPHLHFEVRISGNPVDPAPYL
jgi:murein DD-endopeptidase MepM/ murein hydrolase activator NlpD